MPGPVDARVVQTPHGFKVLPPDVFKRAGAQFTFLNRTASVVFVTFPDQLQMTPSAAEIRPGQVGEFTIGHPEPGVYEYFVELNLTDNSNARQFKLRASGGSDPHIIIDF